MLRLTCQKSEITEFSTERSVTEITGWIQIKVLTGSLICGYQEEIYYFNVTTDNCLGGLVVMMLARYIKSKMSNQW